MKISLPGLFANITRDMLAEDCSRADVYGSMLGQLKMHIEELVQGKHTVAEFAEFYCISAPRAPAEVK